MQIRTIKAYRVMQPFVAGPYRMSGGSTADEERRLHTIAFHEWGTVRTASNAPPIEGNRIGIPDGTGLGIDVQPELFGAPFFEIGS